MLTAAPGLLHPEPKRPSPTSVGAPYNSEVCGATSDAFQGWSTFEPSSFLLHQPVPFRPVIM